MTAATEPCSDRPEADAFAATVIIPTLGRPVQLVKALRALARQLPVPGGFEVLEVDDGGDPPLVERALREDSGSDCRVVRMPNGGPAAARNFTSRQARGRLLIFTDDDCEPEPSWLQGLVARHAESEAPRIIGGRTVNRLLSNPFAATSQNISTIGYAYQNSDPEQARFFASNNLSIPRREYERLGGFNERFRTAEDRDLCDRWRCSGKTMADTPKCVVLHSHRMGLTGFWRQHFAYGRGAYRFHAEHRKRQAGDGIVSWPYYRALLASMWPLRGLHATPALAFALGVSQVANLFGFVWEHATNATKPAQSHPRRS